MVSKRKERIKQLRKEEKQTLQKIISWFEKVSLNEVDYLLFLKDINPLLTDCFPVVCMTVNQLNELFEDNSSLHFDHIFGAMHRIHLPPFYQNFNRWLLG